MAARYPPSAGAARACRPAVRPSGKDAEAALRSSTEGGSFRGRGGMSSAAREGHLRFVTRVYRLRLLGLGLGALPVASVLYQLHAAWWLWGLLAVNALVWPHLAHLRASRSARPIETEHGNLVIDAAMGGAWVALMQFNL